MLLFNNNKKLTVIHKGGGLSSTGSDGLLRLAVGTEPLASIILDCFGSNNRLLANSAVLAIPQDWAFQTFKAGVEIIRYKENLPVPSKARNPLGLGQWFIISNGRFVTLVDDRWLWRVLARHKADVVAVNVAPTLQAPSEKVLFSSQGMLVGFRRLYNDWVQLRPIPDDWPHLLFINIDASKKLLIKNSLPLAFPELLDRCFSNSLLVRALSIGGAVLDLETEEGLLGAVATAARLRRGRSYITNGRRHNKTNHTNSNGTMSAKARLFGEVILGENVHISGNAVVAGPTVLGDNSRIGEGAVVNASIVGPGISIPENCFVQNRVLLGEQSKDELFIGGHNVAVRHFNSTRLPFVKNKNANNNFRTWPWFAYPRCLKRIGDIIASLAILILSSPIFAVVAVVVKLSSLGPVFFKDKRQGLHGRTFNCLKFRTMYAGTHKMQDHLRAVNEVDGPQFKLKNDPRVSIVGKFLRESYIDEMPQLINVLLGQMSIVGPRPSPESENILCPSWRDARLSVRPGITGLWQVRRTRRSGCDFQEWIYHDTEYVKSLSLHLDLLILWQTSKEVIINFIKQL
ncbi:MAG: sugar transferase [Sedimentisphaerales bacterium]|nr:sugar transferase [Sedimentisphaerales bacterium]